MSTLKGIVAAVRDVQSQPELRSGRLGIKLNPVQTLEAKAHLRGLAKEILSEVGDESSLPDPEVLFLALLKQANPNPSDDASDVTIERYLEHVFHPAQTTPGQETERKMRKKGKKRVSRALAGAQS